MKLINYYNKPVCFLLFIFIIGISGVNARQNIPALIPLPHKVEWNDGQFLLSEKTVVNVTDSNLRNYFISQIKSLTGLQLVSGSISGNNNNNTILFTIDETIKKTNREAYSLSVLKQRIVVKGSGEEALFRGMQTLFQLIPAFAKTDKNEKTIEIPCCNISD